MKMNQIIAEDLKLKQSQLLKINSPLKRINKMKEELKLGDKIKAFGHEYEIVGLSRMVYDKDCEGEPEWKITKEIQEVAIAKIYSDVSFQKPTWIKLEVLTLSPKEDK